jgi:hypothetical protein
MILSITVVLFSAVSVAGSDEAGGEWLRLIGGPGLDPWQHVDNRIVQAEDAKLRSGDPTRLEATPGTGTFVVEESEEIEALVTKETFGSIDLHAEFLIAQGSNSGIKLHGHYEIQIYDSFGKKQLHGSDCGGVYPRWKWSNDQLTYLDEGVPPLVNAAKEPGQWQTLDLTFTAPRFDTTGRKIENARLNVVKLNGQVIHQDVELRTPTGLVTVAAKEVSHGPILIQLDHGPVAFRNVRVRRHAG